MSAAGVPKGPEGSRRIRVRASGQRLGFADRHPEVVFAAMTGWCAFYSYLYVNGLLGSRESVRGSWLAAVGAGAITGLGLTSLLILSRKRGMLGRLVLACLIVLFASFVVTARQLFVAITSPGTVTSMSEAAIFALSAVLWVVLTIMVLAHLPAAWRQGVAMRGRLNEDKDAGA